MDLSRRSVLRSAAVLGGAAAISPVLGSLSEAAVAASPRTTLGRTYGPGAPDAKGFRKIVQLAGEPHQVRVDLGVAAGADREDCRVPLLAFAQFSDVHVVDHQSPGRVEWLDRFEDPNDEGLTPGLLTAAYRPHEMLTAQVMDAMVQAVNAIHAGPVTGLPLAFMIETGDNSDNCQKNEVRWNIDILDGESVRPDSGSYSRYEGVMDGNVVYYDIHYWHPEGTPPLKKDDMLRADHGFPVVKGLLDAARRPFTAAGLDVPWYTCFGNHDGLIQGNFPARTTQLSTLCTGPVKIITLPPGISQSDVLDAIQHNQLDELLTSILTLPGVRLVTPDPARKSLSRAQIVVEHFNTTSTPVGHGFTADNLAQGTAYYSFDQGDFRFVVMDSVNPNGYADGSLDQAQFDWLQATIADADDKAVLVFSHHTSDTMSNPLVLTGLDPSPRVLGPEVTGYLLSQPQVIAWVNGHTHKNQIVAHSRGDGTGGFWEINTASHIDYPQQARLIEVADNRDGTLSIFTTIVDHGGGLADYSNLSSTVSLAAIARELSANDPQSDLDGQHGNVAARNAELLVATPPGLLGGACTPVTQRVLAGA
jgi:metallophosphoesterase (TIGR03767 family)